VPQAPRTQTDSKLSAWVVAIADVDTQRIATEGDPYRGGPGGMQAT
jgi:hypothetical protein